MKTGLSRTLTVALAIVFLLPGLLQAQSKEAVAVITEIKLNRGEVELRLPGKKESAKPALLQSLYAGTQIHVSKDARAVILFTEGMKAVTVEEKNSPFEVKAAEAKGGQAGAKAKEVAGLLMGKKKPPAYVPLAVRGGKHPPTLISPRNSKLLTELPTFKWMGMEMQRGTVRVYGPEGELWVAENVALTQIRYPEAAPRLRVGVDYYWTIEKKGFPAEKVKFRLMGAEEAKVVKEKLGALEGAGLPKATLAALKAGVYAAHELFSDARETLMEAIGLDPNEPTLHFLLGELYEKTGLKNLSAEEYSEAQFLMRIRQ